ncbi:Rsd/AlgQ family anti-sigma factor [Microbulbifer sp. MLAF003]|uniref:Rsd/AlgQ family anti-sigma factor n=1 Tax=Microbulbifer sp. MLAF003 TaxID=3032582 RepID=UPI003341B538
MLENCKSARERWGGVSEIIDRWLQSRQNLLVSFYHLSEKKSSVKTTLKLRIVCASCASCWWIMSRQVTLKSMSN